MKRWRIELRDRKPQLVCVAGSIPSYSCACQIANCCLYRAYIVGFSFVSMLICVNMYIRTCVSLANSLFLAFSFPIDRHSPSLPTETDQHGNLNNIVSVAPHLPEYDSNLPPVGANEPPSPVESYDFSMPSNGDYTAEPMVMPSLFKISTLDDNISEQKEKSNPSGYVCLNHLFDVGSSSPTDPIKTMATVQRYKVDKFITTVMIVNAAMPTSGPISVPVATRHQELDIPVGNSVGSDPDVGITPGRPTPADLAVSPRMGAHS